MNATSAQAVVFFSDDFERTTLNDSIGSPNGLVQNALPSSSYQWFAKTRVWDGGGNLIEVLTNGADGVTAHNGRHFVELDTWANSSMSTKVNLVNGQSYKLRFHTRARSLSSQGGGIRAIVTAGSYSSGYVSAGDPLSWSAKEFTFTYTGVTGEATLTFEATGTSNGVGTLLDDITLETTISGDLGQPVTMKGILPPHVPGLLSKDGMRTDIVTPLVVNKQAAIALGKALFWDQAIGSDQMACASCHFHSGADNRIKNQIDPGLNHNAPTGTTFELTRSGNLSGPNYTLTKADFPFDPNSDDIASSAGTFSGAFNSSLVGSNDDACDRMPGPVFHVNQIGTRNVEPRNTPTTVNAAFNHRNFWDGRANNEFNGVSPFGRRESGAGVFINSAALSISSDARVAVFQQGNSGYAGTVDTYVNSSARGTSYAGATDLYVNDGSPNEKNVLIRFNSLFGSGPGQIPFGAKIKSASLRVQVTRTDALDYVTIHSMLAPWGDTSTWTTLGSGVSLNNVEASSTQLFRLSAGASGPQTFDGLASTVQAWSDGAPNNGWIIATGSSDADDWAMASAETATSSQGPMLIVTYTPPGVSLPTMSKIPLKLKNSSLASQAVGPVGSDLEMACRARKFADVGRKVLNRQPLALQTIASDDSVLSSLSTLIGTNGTYSALVQKAFAPEYWNGACGSFCGTPNPGVSPSTPYSHMEANFSLFFGLAVQMYEETLISDDARFDRSKRGLLALTTSERNGESVFNGKGECNACHKGPTLSNASILQTSENVIEGMIMRNNRYAIYDRGFYNLGVVPTNYDIGGGGTDPFGNPLSFSRQYVTDRFVDSFGVEPCKFETDDGLCSDSSAAQRARRSVAVDGTFKVPTLRNVTHTGPYMHNGSLSTLDQVVDFYNRGGNFDNFDKHPDIKPLGLTTQEKADLVAFLKTLSDDRVLFERAPFDHPSLKVPHGHVGNQISVVGGNPLQSSLGVDEILSLPAVGKNGKAAAIPTFESGLQ